MNIDERITHIYKQGFIISDYEGVDRITTPPGINYTFSLQSGILAGIDMVIKISKLYMFLNILGYKIIISAISTHLSFLMLQIMIPYDYPRYFESFLELVHKNVIPMSRIDDAVRRILRVKFTMGLFENPFGDYSLANEIGKQVWQYL